MKHYEAIVLLMAPLGTGLAAFDYASGWDQPAAVPRRAAAPAKAPCPHPQHGMEAAGVCVRAVPAQAAPRTELAAR